MCAKDNVLYELAETMAIADGLSTAVALRKLAQAGYGSLDEVDSASDWILLSIPGLGVGRLGAVRRLTRPDWQPPSPQAIKAVDRFLSAARLALRLWSVEALLGVVQGSSPLGAADRPADERLTLELLSEATYSALCHCSTGELVETLRQFGHDDYVDARQEPEPSRCLDAPTGRGPVTRQETDHFAYPHCRRQQIVEHYRDARGKGQIVNKDRWAQVNYRITSKTLLSYEREFQDQRQVILAPSEGR
jgi:hypothetical protein